MCLKDYEVGSEQIALLGDLFTKCDNKFLDTVDKNFDQFIGVLTKYMKAPGIKWDDIIIIFEWSFERNQMLKYIE